MKRELLETFEEKFYFKTSHFFWHLVTGIAGLALIAGLGILLWGLTPSLKPNVKKVAEPAPVRVAAEEIMQRLSPPPTKPATSPSTPNYTATETAASSQAPPVSRDSTEVAFLAAIDSLKSLLPPNKFSWASSGHYERTWYETKWVVDVLGINDRLQAAYRKVNATDYATALPLLNAYISLVAMFPLDQRLKVLKAATEFTKDDVPTSVQNLALLHAAIPHFSTSDADFVEMLSTFGKKNPRDGRAFIEYANTILPKFDAAVREPLLRTLIASYYNYFNDIGRQQEATNLFMEMQNQFEPDKQVSALAEYYQLYRDKNYDREREIVQIEQTYQNELAQAEAAVVAKKAKKAGWRSLGLKVVGGSFIFISFVALFLVLLSIQRNIRQLRELTAK